jgi:hypothetical protein
VRARLRHERLVRGACGQADDLEGVAHHIERLRADRPRRPEDEEPLHRRLIVATPS